MKRAFDVKYEAFFIIFKGLSVVKNCLRPENAPLMRLFDNELFQLSGETNCLFATSI